MKSINDEEKKLCHNGAVIEMAKNFINKKRKMGLNLLYELAMSQNTNAIIELGKYYEKKKDYTKALFWYENGMRNKSYYCYKKIGEFLENGYGYEKDINKAKEIYIKLKKVDYVESLACLLGWIDKYSTSKYKYLWEYRIGKKILDCDDCSFENHKYAHSILAKLYYFGYHVKKDIRKAHLHSRAPLYGDNETLSIHIKCRIKRYLDVLKEGKDAPLLNEFDLMELKNLTDFSDLELNELLAKYYSTINDDLVAYFYTYQSYKIEKTKNNSIRYAYYLLNKVTGRYEEKKAKDVIIDCINNFKDESLCQSIKSLLPLFKNKAYINEIELKLINI